MDPNGGQAGPALYDQRQRDIQVDNAIRAIQEKKPLPEIDFTIHTMEDGTQVSTLERVSKGAHVHSRSVAVGKMRPCY
jgi:serine/threonine-protein phosphatase 2B catalytic subunit